MFGNSILFLTPTEKDFKKITGKHCNGIAYQVNIDIYSDNDLGNFSREYAVLILNKLAENMTAGESILKYFERKESVAGNVDECGWTEEKTKQRRGEKSGTGRKAQNFKSKI